MYESTKRALYLANLADMSMVQQSKIKDTEIIEQAALCAIASALDCNRVAVHYFTVAASTVSPVGRKLRKLDPMLYSVFENYISQDSTA